MNISVPHSTSNRGLSATSQAPRELEGSQKFLEIRDTSRLSPEICPQCGSANLSPGAGLKPGQMSLKCSECKAFIGYKNVEKLQKLQKLRRKKTLAPCIKFLEECGITAVDEIVFILSELNQTGGAS
jgi:hypothetical protein